MNDVAEGQRSARPHNMGVSRRDQTLAYIALAVSFVLFVLAVPSASRALPRAPAFIPAYETTLILSDILTAAVLFGQFTIVRSNGLFVLAFGYLLNGVIATAHELSFPGAFSPHGLIGGGGQATPWLYVLWHAAFPICVILYALIDGQGRSTRPIGMQLSRNRGGWSVAAAVVLALATLVGLLLLLGRYSSALPIVIRGDVFQPLMTQVTSAVCGLCLVALGFLWRRRSRSKLDLWLMVVVCVWLFDTSLGQIFNSGRYDLGWYAGRVYGFVASVVLLIMLLSQGARDYRQLLRVSDGLAELSRLDGLTGIANRRQFDDYLALQLGAMRRENRTLALILCDVDSFKSYNDHHGHLAGDDCLRRVAAALSTACRRPSDLAARYGGEEFALILPETDLAGALQIAEAARKAVAALEISHGHSSTSPFVTISGGIAMSAAGGQTGPQELLATADKLLFRAKSLGRNRIVSADVMLLAERLERGAA